MVTPAGMNVSPPLAWTPGPATTKSYAMTLIHDAADMSIHWVLWDIPASVASLAPDVEKVAQPTTPAGSKQVQPNLDGSTWYGYQGPCPQAAGSRQNYLYAVYALDVEALPGVTPQSTSAQAMSAIRAHQVARATLQGNQIRQ
jgi:Raf kinase inhibitor-like YbhB/YbcL family protein